MTRTSHALALSLGLALAAAPAAALTLQPGHVLAVTNADPGGGWDGPRTIVQIDPETGATTGSLTLGTEPVPGLLGINDLVVLPDGDLMVGTNNASVVGFAFRLDPTTGAIGPVLFLDSLFGGQMLALEPGGTVVTPGLHKTEGSSILRIDATPSSVSPIASLESLSFFPVPIAVGLDGTLYASGLAEIVGFDPVSGATATS